MIIEWEVKHWRYTDLPSIQLCGRFRDWTHFRAVEAAERARGWVVVSAKAKP